MGSSVVTNVAKKEQELKMAQKPKIKRTYQGFIRDPEGVKSTNDFYRKAAAFLLNEWLKLMGGFKKEFTPPHLARQADLLCLSFWFTPVYSSSPVEFGFPADQLQSRFVSYWGNDEFSPAILRVFETAKSGLKEGVKWVDRRRQFIASGMKHSEVELLFRDPGFILWGNGDDDDESESSAEYVRSMISRYWNVGVKPDYSKNVPFLCGLREKLTLGTRIRDILPISDYHKQLAKWSKEKESEGKHPVVKYLRSKLDGKGGRASAFMVRMAKNYESPLDSDSLDVIQEGISSEIETSQYRVDFKEMPCFTSIKPKLLKYLGVKDLGTNICCDMFAMVLPSYRSWRSNFLRQIAVREQRYQAYLELSAEKVDDRVARIVEESKKSNQPGVPDQKHLRVAQFRGINRLLKWWKSKPKDYLQPIKEDRYGWGDIDLLSKLGGVLCENPNAKSIIDALIKRERACDDYLNMRHPYINFDRGQNPRFSEAKLLFDEVVEGRGNVRYVEMVAVKNGGFVKTKVPVASKRLFREINPGECVEPGRTTPLMVSLYGKDIAVDPNPVSVQLTNKEGRRWYFNFSMTLPERKPIKDFCEKLRSQDGVSILGIDLGWRDAIAFMHLKTAADGEIPLVNARRSSEVLRFNYVEGGFLDDAHLTSRYAKSVRTGEARLISRLTGTSVSVTKEDVAIWEEAKSLVGWKGEIPTTRLPFAKLLAKCAKKVAYQLSLGQAEQHVKKIQEHLSWRAKRGGEGFTRHGMGALTVDRMVFLTDLKSAYQTINSRYEGSSLPRNEWIDERIKKLQQRIVNIRRERVRLIVNLILRKTVEIGAVLISVEDISLQPNQSQDSRTNKRISNWCAKQIAKKLVEGGNELGIIVKSVDPSYSSMTDLFVLDWRPRFNKYNVNTDSFDYVVKKTNKKLLTATGDRATVLTRWLEAKTAGKDLKTILRSEANEDGEVFVPEFMGKFYPSSHFGWMDADVHAAGNIALRGARLLLGWIPRSEKRDGEDDRGSNNGSKSKTRKQLRTNKSASAPSQDITPVRDLCWGVPSSFAEATGTVTWRPSRGSDDKVYTLNGFHLKESQRSTM